MSTISGSNIAQHRLTLPMKHSKILPPILQTLRGIFGSRRSSNSKPRPLLPVEILIAVVHYLQRSPAELYNLTLCSRTFHQITLKLLYQHITLRSKRGAEAFLATIDLHPELRQSIQTFRTAWDRSHEVSSGGDMFFTPEPKSDTGMLFSRRSPYSQRMEDVLAMKQLEFLNDPLPNLRSLAIGLMLYEHRTGAGAVPSINHMLRHLSLTKLSLTPDSIYVGLSVLFQNQPLLRHLELPGVYRITPLLPTDIPLLETFVGESMVAMHIVPGRPIKKLTFLRGVTNTDLILPYHESGSDNRLQLQELSFQGIQPSFSILGIAEFMPVIVRTMPNLRYLKISLIFSGEAEESARAFKNFFMSMPRHISRMTNLEYFSLIKTRVSAPKRPILNYPFHRPALEEGLDLNNDLVVQHLLDTWAASCPTLNQVIMPDSSLWQCSRDGVWRKFGHQVLHPDECAIYDIL